MMLNPELLNTPLDEIIRSKEYDQEQKCELIDEIIKINPEKLFAVCRSREKTLLHLAVLDNQPLVVRKLLALGISPNVVDKYLKTPMHTAAYKGYAEVLGILCRHPRANLFALDRRKNTFLHLAARYRQVNCFAVVAEFAFAFQDKNKNGFTVLDLINQIEELDIRQSMQEAYDKMSIQTPFSVYRRGLQDAQIDQLCHVLECGISLTDIDVEKVPEVKIPTDEFTNLACQFDITLEERMLKKPFEYKSNSEQILLTADAIRSDETKQIISLIYQYCFKIKFNNQNIIKVVYGLFDYYSPEAILLSIKLISENLEGDQLIVGHYFVKQFLQTCYERNIQFSKRSFGKIFSEYCAVAIRRVQEEDKQWIELLNALRLLLIKKVDVVVHHDNKFESSMMPSSWMEDIHSLIDSEDDIHISQVRKFTLEMRALSLELYKSAISVEFCGNHWTREKSKLQFAPIISAHSQQSTALSLLIADVILSKQSPHMRARAMTFFIMALNCLMEVHDDVGPDLNTMMAVSGALDIYPISRLKKTWAQVPEELMRSWKKIGQLLAPNDNFHQMRVCQNNYPLLLPFLGLFKKDYQALYEFDVQVGLLSLGEIHQYLQYLKENLAQKTICTTTDLLYVLKKNSIIDEECLVMKSFQLEPRVPTLYSFPIDEILNDLINWRNQSLPLTVKVKCDTFEGKYALGQICQWLQKLLRDKEIEMDKAMQIVSECVSDQFPIQSKDAELAKYLKRLEPTKVSLLSFQRHKEKSKSKTPREKISSLTMKAKSAPNVRLTRAVSTESIPSMTLVAINEDEIDKSKKSVKKEKKERKMK